MLINVIIENKIYIELYIIVLIHKIIHLWQNVSNLLAPDAKFPSKWEYFIETFWVELVDFLSIVNNIRFHFVYPLRR